MSVNLYDRERKTFSSLAQTPHLHPLAFDDAGAGPWYQTSSAVVELWVNALGGYASEKAGNLSRQVICSSRDAPFDPANSARRAREQALRIKTTTEKPAEGCELITKAHFSIFNLKPDETQILLASTRCGHFLV